MVTNMAMVTDMAMGKVRLYPHKAHGENYFDSCGNLTNTFFI
jgi:hypothetical protein